MAQQHLDKTGNESQNVLIAKIEENFSELYSADASNTNWSGTTVAATGLVSGGTVTSTGLATVGTLKVGTSTKTATAVAGAATLNKPAGVITTEALTTAKGAEYELTLTNSSIVAADQVFASVQFGSASAGLPVISRVTPASGSVKIRVLNADASDAFDGTLKISFFSLKN